MQNLFLFPELEQSFLPVKKLKTKALTWLEACRKDDKTHICCLWLVQRIPIPNHWGQSSSPRPELLPRPLARAEFICMPTPPSWLWRAWGSLRCQLGVRTSNSPTYRGWGFRADANKTYFSPWDPTWQVVWGRGQSTSEPQKEVALP